MISKRCKYAIKALIHIARNQDRERPVFSTEIAEKENIPRKFLEGILRDLSHAQILYSKRGKQGGYRLLKPADQITLVEIMRIMDGPIALLPCVSLHYYRPCDECVNEQNCSIRSVFIQVRDAHLAILKDATLESLSREAEAESPDKKSTGQ